MISEKQPQFETSSSNYQPSYEYTGATLLSPETDIAFRLAGERLLSVEEARQMTVNAPVVERERPLTPDEQKVAVVASVNRNIRSMRDYALAA